MSVYVFFFQAEDGIRDIGVTGVQTCALPISAEPDLVFVLGGDGTMLKASRMYPGRVLLGVNLGKVGFMSGTVPEEIEAGGGKVLGGGLEGQEYRMLEVGVAGEEAQQGAKDAVLLQKRADQLIRSEEHK